MTERFANDVATVLVGSITAGATSLVVASSSGFPSAGNFRVRIDDEILLVTGVGGTTWTVTRAAEGTAAAPHAGLAVVAHVLTAGGLAQAIADAVVGARSAVFVGTRTAASYADVDSTNGKVSLTTNGGDLLVIFTGFCTNSSTGVVQFVALRLDAGSEVPSTGFPAYSFAGLPDYPVPFCVAWLFTGVSAGSHTVYARHSNVSAIGTMVTTGQLVVLEL